MDIKPPACNSCGYALPVTWTSKIEMGKVMTAVGWELDPPICPTCRRKSWLKRSSTFVRGADLR